MKESKFDKGVNILGGLASMTGSLIGAYNNVNPLDLNTINQARLDAYTVGNTAFGTSSMSGLMDLYNNLPQLLQLSALDIYDPSSGERFSLLFGAGYGAYQGTLALTDNFDWDNIKKEASQKAFGGKLDPSAMYSSIINLAGAGLGMGLNAISNAALKRKAEEAALRLNILNDFALNRQNHNFNIAVEDTKNNMFNNLAILMMADGGSIYIKPSKRGTFTEAAKRRGLGVLEFADRVLANKENYSPAMVRKANFSRNSTKWHAFGGNLSTLGSDWTNGLNWINNGGTHEANPQDGVPMGIAPDGKPNLVEEGEVIFNDDYVFSNRLKVPKVIRDKYKLKDDITFAEAIKKLSKESEERPNDPISLDGLDVFINDLTASQEEVRMKKLANELKQLIENMSPEELQGLQLLMLQQEGELPMFAYGGHKYADGSIKPYAYDRDITKFSGWDAATNDYKLDYLNFVNSITDENLQLYITNRLAANPNAFDRFKKVGNKLDLLTAEDVRRLATDKKYSNMHDFVLEYQSYTRQNEALPYAKPVINSLDVLPVKPSVDLKKEDVKSNVPPIESNNPELLPTWMRYAPVAGGALGALTSVLEEPKDYSTNVPFRQSTFEPIGDYVRYTPIDTLRYINAANQLAAALRESILNASSGNRALTLANMAAANYANQQGLASIMNQAEQINWPRQVQASEFNRGTNLFNALAFNLSSLANMALNNLKLNQAQLNAAYRRAGDLARDEAISGNLSDLFTSLGNIGTENFNMNMVNENPALYYALLNNGKINYKRKDGSLLTKKNRRK